MTCDKIGPDTGDQYYLVDTIWIAIVYKQFTEAGSWTGKYQGYTQREEQLKIISRDNYCANRVEWV